MSALTIERSHLADTWTAIAVGGEIDIATVGEFEKAVESVLQDGNVNLVIDLTGASFMDSTGLKSLVTFDRKFYESGRSFAIAVTSGPISRLIDLSGVAQSLRVLSNPSEAIEA